jgi:hypothetical protein
MLMGQVDVRGNKDQNELHLVLKRFGFLRLFSLKLNNFMEQSLPREANSFSANQEISRLLWDRNPISQNRHWCLFLS